MGAISIVCGIFSKKMQILFVQIIAIVCGEKKYKIDLG